MGGGGAQYRSDMGRDDHRDVARARGDSVVGRCAIIGAIGRDAANPGVDLVEQRSDLRRISDIVLGQGRCHDHPGLSIHGQMQFSPGTPRSHTVLFLQPFAGAKDFQPGAVDQQMDRSIGQTTAFRNGCHRHGPATQGAMVGCRQRHAHQLEDRRHQSLCLAQRQVKRQAQHQSRFDRQIRIARLTCLILSGGG